MRSLKSRLRRLEMTMQREEQYVVVWGRDESEQDAQIDKLEQAGLIDGNHDQIVCIMCFSNEPVHPPQINGSVVTLTQELGAHIPAVPLVSATNR